MRSPDISIRIGGTSLDHLFCIIPCLTDHVDENTLLHIDLVIGCLSVLLLVEAAKADDTGLNEIDVYRLAGSPEATDHPSEDMVVYVDVLEIGKQVLCRKVISFGSSEPHKKR